MKLSRFVEFAGPIILALLVNSCFSSRPSEVESVQQALQNYSRLILHMDNDGIADLFTEQGEIINPGQPEIKGRESIRKFLGSFTEYKVIAESLQPDSTSVSGTRAVQFARYHQKVLVPSGKTLDASGRIKIEWVLENGRWLIVRAEDLPKK
jgi:uncharacterized protein (TIGR02246 family)